MDFEPARAKKTYSFNVPFNFNGRFFGDIAVEVDLEGNGRVDVERYIELVSTQVDAETIDAIRAAAGGQAFISFEMASISPLEVTYDASELALIVTVAANSLTAKPYAVGQRAVPDPKAYMPPAGVVSGLGIGFQQAYTHGDGEGMARQPLRGEAQGFVSMGGFEAWTLSYEFDYEEDASEEFERGLFLLTKDNYDQATRLFMGEFNPGITSFQSSPQILGIGYQRFYERIRPFQNIRPSGRNEIVLEEDSRVDFIVNGVIVDSTFLRAGRYNISDFQFATGSNEVTIVVDNGGIRTEIAEFGLFYEPQLLGKGISDFSLSAGVPRSAGSSDSFPYDSSEAIATGYIAYGISDSLTVKVDSQATTDNAQIGGGAAIGTSLGLFEIDATVSEDWEQGLTGYALGLNYAKVLPFGENGQLRLVGNVDHRSPDFTTANTGLPNNPQSILADFDARLDLAGRFSAALGAIFSDGRNGVPDRRQLNASIGRSFGKINLSVTGSVIDNSSADIEYRAVIGLNYRFDRRHSVRSSFNTLDNQTTMTFARSQRDQLNDVSGRINIEHSDTEEGLSGGLTYLNNRFEADFDRSIRVRTALDSEDRVETSSFSATTFIGAAGRQIALGRQGGENAFIIVDRHNSLRESTLMLGDGTTVKARSGVFGPAILPIDRTYTPVRIALEVDPLPEGYDIGGNSIDILPSEGAGYHVTIGSDASRTLLGRFIADDPDDISLVVGTLTPRNGDESLERKFFTNRTGRFVIEKVAPGTYDLKLPGFDPIELVVEEETEGLINVGKISLGG